MAKSDREDDYLNLGAARNDDFALGEPTSDSELDQASLPPSLYIIPLIMGFVIIVGLMVYIFIMRAWDHTPKADFDQQEVRVIEPLASEATTSNSKSNKIVPVPNSDVKVATVPSNPPANSSLPSPNAPINPTTTTSNSNTATNVNANRPISERLGAWTPAVGMVLAKTNDGLLSSGTGFVIRDTGLFVTNHHVIEGAIDMAVKLNNSDSIHKATVIKDDAQKDIAILQLQERETYPTLMLEDNPLPVLGEDIMVLGYPLGTKLGLELTISPGIVSSIRNLPEISLIQTNAAINHGNSGGPMLSLRTGKVLGIVTAKAKDSESIGFAINIKELKKILE